jgi:hypothetical protein
LIGGVAVGYHGHVRAGELPDPLAPGVLAMGGNWILLTRLGRLDVMQWIGEMPLWSELSPSAIQDSVGSIPIKVVSYEDLLRLKKMAGRPEDLADLQRLREARESRPPSPAAVFDQRDSVADGRRLDQLQGVLGLAFGEEAFAFAEEDGEDHQPQLVDQVGFD